ncbi:MAG: helix-turn-helix transcriptional regulator [Phycisphaerales bacterium]|nr:MAG: helix-turn-helix transcriptional regulator [Phycisphaerales bacterium]
MSDGKKAARLAELFKLLSVDARVRIVQLLKGGALCVTELTSKLGITVAATSHHLRLLRGAGIVKGVKHGLFVYYDLNKKKMAELDKAAAELLKLGVK